MRERTKTYPGINIQYPISRLILDGSKTIETRTYPIPEEYIGKEMALIETPGRDGNFKARIVGIVTFGESFKYNSKAEFYLDEERHCVSRQSPWKWQTEKPKWGWPILEIRRLDGAIPAPKKRGIKFTKSVMLPSEQASVQF